MDNKLFYCQNGVGQRTCFKACALGHTFVLDDSDEFREFYTYQEYALTSIKISALRKVLSFLKMKSHSALRYPGHDKMTCLSRTRNDVRVVEIAIVPIMRSYKSRAL
jgi:hypothetical protein